MKLFIDFVDVPFSAALRDQMTLSSLRVENDDGHEVYRLTPGQIVEPGDTVEIQFPGLVVHIDANEESGEA